jgi:hypothetical protein
MSNNSYAGRPELATRIQAEIAVVTGTIAQPVLCSCGRHPVLVSLAYGITQVKCFCGRNGSPAIGQGAAITSWNLRMECR